MVILLIHPYISSSFLIWKTALHTCYIHVAGWQIKSSSTSMLDCTAWALCWQDPDDSGSSLTPLTQDQLLSHYRWIWASAAHEYIEWSIPTSVERGAAHKQDRIDARKQYNITLWLKYMLNDMCQLIVYNCHVCKVTECSEPRTLTNSAAQNAGRRTGQWSQEG